MVELLSKWRRASARLTDVLRRAPTAEEIARSLALPKKKLPIIRKAIQINQAGPQSEQTEAGWTLGDMVMDERSRTPEDTLLEQDVLKQVRGLLSAMDSREAAVLKMRFGLDGNEAQTLKEIGAALDLTRERVRQIETQAIGRLANGLKDPRDRSLDGLPTA